MSQVRPVDVAVPSVARDTGLVRAFGTVGLTAAIINVIVGAGIFMLPALLATRLGAAAPLAFLVGAIAILPITLCFAAAGSRAVATGGPYSYVGEAFGTFPGFIAGALMWFCNVSSSAGVAAALAEQAANAFPMFAQTGPRTAFLVAVYTALVLLNAFGVKLGVRAIVTLATLKLTPLVVLAVAGLFLVDFGAFDLGEMPTLGTLGAAMVLVMFAYSGVETALIPSGEVRDPARMVPRATLAAILIVVLLYMGIQVATQGLLGNAIEGSTSPIADAAGRAWEPGRVIVLITASISMTGFLMGNLLGSSRLLFALGRDGYLPVVGRLTKRFHVPLAAILVHGAIGMTLAIAGTFEKLALISGGANCLIYIAVAIAAWQLQRRDVREIGARPFVLPGGPAIPLLSVLAMGAIVATLKPDEWAAIAIALVALVTIYATLRLTRRRESVLAASDASRRE